MMTSSKNMTNPSLFLAALASFVLAAFTGSYLRYGMLYGFAFGLQFVNVRHAHSHLMFFAWVSPALMSLIIESFFEEKPRYSQWVIALTILAGLGSYVPFLLSGYGKLNFFGHELPLSMMAAGLNMLLWYAFMLIYLRGRRSLRASLALRLVDSALVLWFLSSLAAWSIAFLSILKLANPERLQMLIDLFLGLYAQGFFVLALLGILMQQLALSASRLSLWGLSLLALPLPLAVLIYGHIDHLSGPWQGMIRIALALEASGLALLLAHIWPALRRAKAWAWYLPLACLSLKWVVDIVLIFPQGLAWFKAMNLRILLVHGLLLGFCSLGLLALAAYHWRLKLMIRQFSVAVLAMFASLILISPLWPWQGLGGFYMLLLSSLWLSVFALVVLSSNLKRLSSRQLSPLSS